MFSREIWILLLEYRYAEVGSGQVGWRKASMAGSGDADWLRQEAANIGMAANKCSEHLGGKSRRLNAVGLCELTGGRDAMSKKKVCSVFCSSLLCPIIISRTQSTQHSVTLSFGFLMRSEITNVNLFKVSH